MQKIINSKKYNTETAKEVAYYDNGCGCGDFRHFTEVLYRKKTGEFFLYGSGGAMSKYCQSRGNSWTGGSEIVPMTVSEAKEWVMDHCDTDTYITLFGKVEE